MTPPAVLVDTETMYNDFLSSEGNDLLSFLNEFLSDFCEFNTSMKNEVESKISLFTNKTAEINYFNQLIIDNIWILANNALQKAISQWNNQDNLIFVKIAIFFAKIDDENKILNKYGVDGLARQGMLIPYTDSEETINCCPKICIFIRPIKNYTRYLESVIVHEFCHSQLPILDGKVSIDVVYRIIAEGLAENFVELTLDKSRLHYDPDNIEFLHIQNCIELICIFQDSACGETVNNILYGGKFTLHSKEYDFPENIGYFVGKLIVQNYLQTANVSIPVATNTAFRNVWEKGLEEWRSKQKLR